jgi:hypothetical protein
MRKDWTAGSALPCDADCIREQWARARVRQRSIVVRRDDRRDRGRVAGIFRAVHGRVTSAIKEDAAFERRRAHLARPDLPSACSDEEGGREGQRGRAHECIRQQSSCHESLEKYGSAPARASCRWHNLAPRNAFAVVPFRMGPLYRACRLPYCHRSQVVRGSSAPLSRSASRSALRGKGTRAPCPSLAARFIASYGARTFTSLSKYTYSRGASCCGR